MPPKKKTLKQIRQQKQHEKETNKSSHHERVQMRAILRKSGRIDPQSDNATADRWLWLHGYLYDPSVDKTLPPKDRVKRLARSLGVKDIPQ